MDWEIQARSSQCAQCAKAFSNDELYHTFLVAGRDDAPRRHDFCLLCFEVLDASWPGTQERHSFWKGRVKISASPEKARPLPFERLEQNLRRLILSTEPRDRKFAYILSLLLERKKILIHRENIEKADGGPSRRFLVYEHVHTGESFALEDPELNLHQVEALQEELKDVMQEALEIA